MRIGVVALVWIAVALPSTGIATETNARPLRRAKKAQAPRTVACEQAAGCPIRRAQSVVLDQWGSVDGIALGADGRAWVTVHYSGTRGKPPAPRGEVLEFAAEEAVHHHADPMAPSHVEADSAGGPVVVSRPWVGVLREHGWIDGSYPRTAGPSWPRVVIEAEVRGVERLAVLDTATGPQGQILALLGHRQSTGQFPLLVTRSSDGVRWEVDVAEAKPRGYADAMDVDAQGRVWVSRTVYRQGSGDVSMSLLAGPVGEPAVTVLDPKQTAQERIAAADLLAPTPTRPALLSIASEHTLRLARLDPAGPTVRAVPQVKGVELREPYEPGDTRRNVVSAKPTQHLLLQTEHHVVLVWLSVHYDQTIRCDTFDTEVGENFGCAPSQENSRSLLNVARVTEALELTDAVSMILPSSDYWGLVGDARGDEVAVALMRSGGGGDKPVSTLDFVRLSVP